MSLKLKTWYVPGTFDCIVLVRDCGCLNESLLTTDPARATEFRKQGRAYRSGEATCSTGVRTVMNECSKMSAKVHSVSFFFYFVLDFFDITSFRYQLAASLARLPERGSLATLIEPTTSEFRTLVETIEKAAATSGQQLSPPQRLRVLRAYGIYSESKIRMFRDRVTDISTGSAQVRGDSSCATESW